MEFVEVDVERARESQRGSDRADDLGDDAIEGLVVGALYTEVAAANVVNRLVIHHKCTIGMLKGRMRCQNRVVRLDHRSRHARSLRNKKIIQIAQLDFGLEFTIFTFKNVVRNDFSEKVFCHFS